MIRAFLCAVGVVLMLAYVNTISVRDPARAFLTSSFKVTNAELDRMDAGQVVSRTLTPGDSREVATLGIVRVRATPQFYVEQLADIVTFKRSEAVLQIGTFGNPPDVHDIGNLTLDEWDVRKLRDCRVGDCGVHLSAEAIERFRQEVDWKRADAQSQASRVMRQMLVEYVTRYRNDGMAGAMNYADQPKPLDTGREFASLIDGDVDALQHFTDLRQHLLQYPRAQTPGTIDILYWSKERASRRTVVTVTHLAISRPVGGPSDYAIASKQIYGAHYFDASLGLTVLLRDGSASPPAMYVLYLNRSRVDVFGGMFGGVAGRIVSADTLTRSRGACSSAAVDRTAIRSRQSLKVQSGSRRAERISTRGAQSQSEERLRNNIS